MKCTECPEYATCSKSANLTIKRRHCPLSKQTHPKTNSSRIRGQIKTDVGLSAFLAEYIPTDNMPNEVREIWQSEGGVTKADAWLRWLRLPSKDV